jgi:hypothetical protein
MSTVEYSPSSEPALVPTYFSDPSRILFKAQFIGSSCRI